MKKPTISKLKKKLWTLFSKYIRLRDADRHTGYGTCITCGVSKPYKELQAGHFLPGRHNSILFDERGCHSQCYGCNCMKQGNSIKYFRYMQDRYGDSVIEELEAKDNETKQFTIEELEDLIEIYKSKLKDFD